MQSFRRWISLSISFWAALIASGWLNAVTVSWTRRRCSIGLWGSQTSGCGEKSGHKGVEDGGMQQLTMLGIKGRGWVFVNERVRGVYKQTGAFCLTGKVTGSF